jgi:nicotinate-nucleotide adenylyltransferase
MTPPPIGIFGGTFNPVHHGHLRSALDICQHLNLQEIQLMPTFMSPHKLVTQAKTISHDISSDHRLAMLNAATDYCPTLSVSDYEVKRAHISYTVETIEYFRQKFPASPLCFLMGMDSFVNFTRWHRWQDILNQCHLVVSDRPGYAIGDSSDINALLLKHQTTSITDLHASLGGAIYLHHAHPLAISSSAIRHLVETHQPVTYLTPPCVEDYINEHQLYRP